MTLPGPLNTSELARVRELVAAETTEALSPEDRAELESLLARAPAALRAELQGYEATMGDFAARTAASGQPMPSDLKARLEAMGQGMIGAGRHAMSFPHRTARSRWVPILAAACAALAAALGVQTAVWSSRAESARARLATLAQSEAAAQRERDVALAAADDARAKLDAQAAQNTALAAQFADASGSLREAQERIAALEAPRDPALAARNRQRLLEVPGTFRIAWQPFDLPDAPAEQRSVGGDVVWNDELEQGFLRFVGLRPNDPGVEQYQVWVIDERGMEQKVSGGVFDATAEGELIIPIDPAIDVRRVAVFAVTIEAPDRKSVV